MRRRTRPRFSRRGRANQWRMRFTMSRGVSPHSDCRDNDFFDRFDNWRPDPSAYRSCSVRLYRRRCSSGLEERGSCLVGEIFSTDLDDYIDPFGTLNAIRKKRLKTKFVLPKKEQRSLYEILIFPTRPRCPITNRIFPINNSRTRWPRRTESDGASRKQLLLRTKRGWWASSKWDKDNVNKSFMRSRSRYFYTSPWWRVA